MLLTMIEAAKEEISSSFLAWCADPASAARMVNTEKPHQGVAPQKSALHPGLAWSNSTTALGLRSLAVENRIRSRCTGKERDAESGMDMFGARYYGSSLGRFMTPDWAASSDPDPVPYADLHNPQSLNLYAYTKNNPTTLTEPNGHCTNNGEQKGGWWCFWHYSDQDRQRDADQARRNLAGVKNITINGATVQDFLKSATNQQVLTAQRAIVDFLSAEAASHPCQGVADCVAFAAVMVGQPEMAEGFAADYATAATVNESATFASEGEARALARTKLGGDAVEVAPGKWRSADGKWQYRAKPDDVSENHIHLERLNPQTGEVIYNLHLRWPEGTER